MWPTNKTLGAETGSNIGDTILYFDYYNTLVYLLSVLLKSTIDANDFQHFLIKISKEEINVEVEADSQEKEYHSNYIDEERSSDEDEDFCTSSSDESIIDL